ncbi:MAG: 2-oxoacid:acceptor oxidoreductase family protein, partial [Anaerolineales bacterium]
MHAEIVIAGFGGQGALFAGQILAYAAMDAGHHVTWIPSYGPEMRGGTAHCTIIISDDEIGSPLVEHPSAVIAMNQPSLDKYAPLVAPGGLLIHSAMPQAAPPAYPGLRQIEIPANAIAEELGSPQAANMVLIGALLAATEILPLAAVELALAAHLPERHRRALDANRQAL